MSYKSAKKKSKNKKWLTRKLRYWARTEKENDRFYTFECSDFFEGKTMAQLNREKYYKMAKNTRRKINQIKLFLSLLTTTK